MAAQLSADEVRQACGDLSDVAVEAIINTGATEADLSAALDWEARSFELRSHGALSDRATQIRRILVEESGFNDEDERRP